MIYGILSIVGIGTKKIIIKEAGTCPKTIAVTATCLSLCDLTILFHKACKNAANKTAKNIRPIIIKILRDFDIFLEDMLLMNFNRK